jgi:type 1 fimbria pilin
MFSCGMVYLFVYFKYFDTNELNEGCFAFTLLLQYCDSGHSAVQVQVIFTGTGDIRKSTLTEIHNQIVNKERLSRLILIVQSKMTAYARKELENCQYKVEIIKVS